MQTIMNENEQVVHYMDNSYSYPVSEGYVDYYSGASTAPLSYLNFAPMHDQVNCYAAMLIVKEVLLSISSVFSLLFKLNFVSDA